MSEPERPFSELLDAVGDLFRVITNALGIPRILDGLVRVVDWTRGSRP